MFNNERTLGVCLALRGGFMTIGGVNPAVNRGAGIVLPHDNS